MPQLPSHATVLHVVPRASMGQLGALQSAPAGANAASYVTTFTGLVRLLDVPDLAAPPAPASASPWQAWHGRLQLAGGLRARGAGDADGGAIAAWDAVAALRRAGVNAALLRRAQQLVPTEHADAAAALCDLLAAYEAALQRHGARDQASAWQRACQVARLPHWPAPLQHVRHVAVHPGAAVEVTGERLQLVLAMASGARSVEVALPFSPDTPQAYPWAEAILGGLEASSATNLMVSFVDDDGQGPLAALRRQARTAHAASQGAAPAPACPRVPAPVTAPPAAARVGRCPPGEATVAHVVQQVHAWVEAGTPPQQIAVVLPAACPPLWPREAYLGRLQQALQEAGLPTCSDRPARAAHHGMGRLLQDVLVLACALAEGQPPAPAAGTAHEVAAVGVAAAAVPLPALAASFAALATADGVEPRAHGALAALLPRLLLRLGNRRLPWPTLAQALASLDDVGPARAREACRLLQHWALQCLQPLLAATTLRGACVALSRLLAAAHAQAAAGHDGAAANADALHAALADLAAADGVLGAPARTLAQSARWLQLLLQETQLPPQASVGGVSLCLPQGCADVQFAKVLLVAANAGVFPRPRPHNAWLAEPLLRALVHVGGPRLAPTASVAAAAPLAADARDQARWRAVLAAATTELQVVVLDHAGSESAGPSAAVQALLDAIGQADLPLLPPAYAAPLALQPSPEALLAAAVHGHALPLAAAAQDLHHAVAAHASAPATARLASLQRRILAAQNATTAPLAAPIAARHQAAWLAGEHRATALDQLGSCRFRYFAEASLLLQPLPLPSLVASVRLRGTAMHAGLEVAMGALLAAPGGLAGQRRDPVAAMDLAERAFVAALPRILPEAAIHPVLYDALRAEVWRAVALRLRADLADAANTPVALEYRFGSSRAAAPALLVAEPAPAHGRAPRVAAVRGSIDRVDRSEASADAAQASQADEGAGAANPANSAKSAAAAASSLAARTTWSTYDYKRSLPQRVAHRHLQLGLYGMVAARDFVRGEAWQRAGWIALAGSQAGKVKTVAELSAAPSALATGVAQDLWARLGPWLDGDVAPDPESPQVCRHCNFIDLCHFRAAGAADDGEAEA